MRPSTQQKKQKILQVATELFLSQGFTGTNLDQIIEQCGGSKQTLYRYFGDKQGLFNAVIGCCIEEMGQIFTFDNDSKLTLQQQLVEFGCSYLTKILSPHFIKRYILLTIEAQSDPQLTEYFLLEGPKKLTRQLSEFLALQVRLEKINIDDTDLAAIYLMSLLKGNHQQTAILTKSDTMLNSEEIAHHVRNVVDFFTQAYK